MSRVGNILLPHLSQLNKSFIDKSNSYQTYSISISKRMKGFVEQIACAPHNQTRASCLSSGDGERCFRCHAQQTRFSAAKTLVRFEEEFARYVGTDYAITTNSGTDALVFIWKALNARGNRIVTSPFSFIASANSLLMAEGYPVFGDISLGNYCLDPIEAQKQLERGAKGILPVHIFGRPVDWEDFEQLGRKYNVPVVEDAAQSHGAFYNGKRVGSLGIAAAFSFYPSKNMTVHGDGGMVTTNEKRIADFVSRVRDGGRISSGARCYRIHFEDDERERCNWSGSAKAPR